MIQIRHHQFAAPTHHSIDPDSGVPMPCAKNLLDPTRSPKPPFSPNANAYPSVNHEIVVMRKSITFLTQMALTARVRLARANGA